MNRMTGTVAVAQEGRFNLAADDGRSVLFILAHDAPMEPHDLPALVERAVRVTVHYEEAAQRHAGLAFDVTEAGAPPSRHIGPSGISRGRE